MRLSTCHRWTCPLTHLSVVISVAHQGARFWIKPVKEQCWKKSQKSELLHLQCLTWHLWEYSIVHCAVVLLPSYGKDFHNNPEQGCEIKSLDAIRVTNLVEHVTSSQANLESMYIIYRAWCCLVKLLFAFLLLCPQLQRKSARLAPLSVKIQSNSKQLDGRNVFLFYLWCTTVSAKAVGGRLINSCHWFYVCLDEGISLQP